LKGSTYKRNCKLNFTAGQRVLGCGSPIGVFGSSSRFDSWTNRSSFRASF
jgi:hypothetical protein